MDSKNIAELGEPYLSFFGQLSPLQRRLFESEVDFASRGGIHNLLPLKDDVAPQRFYTRLATGGKTFYQLVEQETSKERPSELEVLRYAHVLGLYMGGHVNQEERETLSTCDETWEGYLHARYPDRYISPLPDCPFSTQDEARNLLDISSAEKQNGFSLGQRVRDGKFVLDIRL